MTTRIYWKRETLPVLGEVYVIYENSWTLAIAEDAHAAQKIVDALNEQLD